MEAPEAIETKAIRAMLHEAGGRSGPPQSGAASGRRNAAELLSRQ
jgi:hypothetical protein